MTSEAITAEGFTAARELHAQGYPVFIVKYRVSTQRPMEEQEVIAATAIKILIIEMFAMKILMLPIKSNVKKRKKLMMTNGVTFNDIFSAIGC